jgi:hypothetical protein
MEKVCPTKTNEPDVAAMMRAFDLPADDWRGTGYTRSTTLAPDRSRPRRNFSDGAIEAVWDVSHPRTPGPAGGDPLPPIRDRGGMGFSGRIDFGAPGRPQRPRKP